MRLHSGSDGSITVVGISQAGNASELAVARYLANGTVDTMFGSDGRVTTSVQSGPGRAEDVVIQPIYHFDSVSAEANLDSRFRIGFEWTQQRFSRVTLPSRSGVQLEINGSSQFWA